jgi:hypothetical protein
MATVSELVAPEAEKFAVTSAEACFRFEEIF